MYSNLVAKRSVLVEVPLGTIAAGRSVNFEDVPDISRKNIKLYAIESFSAAQLAISPKGRTVIPANAAPSLAFTLVQNSTEQRIFNMPYFNTIRANNAGWIMLLDGLEVTITKCQVNILTASNLTNDQTALFNLYYDYIA